MLHCSCLSSGGVTSDLPLEHLRVLLFPVKKRRPKWKQNLPARAVIDIRRIGAGWPVRAAWARPARPWSAGEPCGRTRRRRAGPCCPRRRSFANYGIGCTEAFTHSLRTHVLNLLVCVKELSRTSLASTIGSNRASTIRRRITTYQSRFNDYACLTTSLNPACVPE
jgi:hypothetical protein